MNFLTKLIISAVTIGATVITSVVGGLDYMDGRTDKKVSEVKKEIRREIREVRKENHLTIKAIDEKVAVQLFSLSNDIGEVRKDVRSLLGIARKSQVFVAKKPNSLYTNLEQASKGNQL